jgi:hypothetical protein
MQVSISLNLIRTITLIPFPISEFITSAAELGQIKDQRDARSGGIGRRNFHRVYRCHLPHPSYQD